jgi:two-component system LytT family sensor kinase
MQSLFTTFFLDRIVFPTTQARRLMIHACFWACFVFGHALFFLPDMLRGTVDSAKVYSYLFYYGKFPFIFYACLVLLRLLQRRLHTLVVLPVMFLLCILVTHLFNILTFKTAAILIGLENTAINFEMLGRAFLRGTEGKWINMISLIIFNMQDMQLLILPVGIKMVKYGMMYQKKLQDTETQRMKNELHQLRTQLGPHFILNVLSSLYVQLRTVSEESAGYLAKLTDLIHYSLHETGQDMITLEREIQCFKTLIDIESGRQQSRLMLSIEQTGSIKPTHRIPSLILMTLAENAFKHGARSERAPSILNVRIAIKANKLDFFMENSKTGSQGTKHNKPSGIGLKNVIRRLELHFNDNFSFKTQETEQMFSVNMTIPISGSNSIKLFDT